MENKGITTYLAKKGFLSSYQISSLDRQSFRLSLAFIDLFRMMAHPPSLMCYPREVVLMSTLLVHVDLVGVTDGPSILKPRFSLLS